MSCKPRKTRTSASIFRLPICTPPLLSEDSASVGFSISAPAGESYEFIHTLNGEPGDVTGISLHAGSRGGAISLNRDFIAQYDGEWPAALELIALKDGLRVTSAVLSLHDTGTMVAHRCEASLTPNPASVPFVDELIVVVRATFFDVNGVVLPLGELAWELLPPESVEGVTSGEGQLIVSPQAPVGDIPIRVREGSGVETSVVLTLLPAKDIGLTAQPVDFYPPYHSTLTDFIVIQVEGDWESGITMSAKLNGEGGRYTGMDLLSQLDFWLLAMDRRFINNYQGAWPIDVEIEAMKGAQVIGFARARMHDTRTMVCTRVEMEFVPADTVQIPQEGEVLVFAAPRFYDANDIRLPHTELEWGAKMVDLIEGVTMVKHVLHIGPNAKPGQYRVAVLGPNGMNRTKVLTLT